MADIVVVPASVRVRIDANPNSENTPYQGTAGEALDAGKAVYLTQEGKFKLAKSNGTSLEADVKGITTNKAYGDGMQVSVVGPEGNIDFGVDLGLGDGLYLSGTYGGICTFGDIGGGMRVIKIGDVTETRNCRLDVATVLPEPIP